MKASSQSKREGFTLIELLVVISVIAVLMSILMPALHRAREQARKSVCLGHMSNIGKLLFLYAQDDDRLPSGGHLAKDIAPLRANYYTYYHVPSWQGKNPGYEGLGYLYRSRLLANDSDIPFCPGMKQFFGVVKSQGLSGNDWNARGNPNHMNYVGPDSSYGCGLLTQDAGIGWINMRWTIGWRDLKTELGIKQFSAAGGARRAFISDVWSAEMGDYWKSRLEDMPHRSGNNCTMNAWYLDGHTRSFRWKVEEYFGPKDGKGDRFLLSNYNWSSLFEGALPRK